MNRNNRLKADKVKFSSSSIVYNQDMSITNQDILNAKKEAERILLQAKKEAEEILIKAQAEAEQYKETFVANMDVEKQEIFNQVKEEAFNEGRMEGIEQSKTDMLEKLELFDKFIENEFKIKEEIIKSAEKDIIELVVQIAEKVSFKAIEMDEEILERIVKESIALLPEKEEISILINPILFEKISSISEKIKETIKNSKTIKIVENRGVSPYGVIVEGINTRIDGRITSQIEEITRNLKEELFKRNNEDI